MCGWSVQLILLRTVLNHGNHQCKILRYQNVRLAERVGISIIAKLYRLYKLSILSRESYVLKKFVLFADGK